MAAFDPQSATAVDADENPGAGYLGGIVDHRSIVEGLQRRLDFAEPVIDLVGELLGLGVFRLQRVELGAQRVAAGLLLLGEGDRLAGKVTQAGRVAVGELDGSVDPLPAFGTDRLGLGGELLDDEPVEQRRILQPATIVLFEEIAHDDTASRLIDGDADELRPLVRGADGAFGELAADVIGLLVIGARERLPNLLLAHMVVGNCEGHELLERHLVLGIEIEKLGRDGGELEALLHHAGGDEEACGDLLLAEARVAQGLEGAELIERMERDTLDILSQRIFRGDAAVVHHARYELGLGHALLLDQQLEGAEPPPARRDLVGAGFIAVGVAHRADAQALQQGAAGDVLRKLLDRDARLDAADIGLGQDQLVEGNVLRRAQDDLGIGTSHAGSPRRAGREPLFWPPNPSHRAIRPLPLQPEAIGPDQGSTLRRRHGMPPRRRRATDRERRRRWRFADRDHRPVDR